MEKKIQETDLNDIYQWKKQYSVVTCTNPVRRLQSAPAKRREKLVACVQNYITYDTDDISAKQEVFMAKKKRRSATGRKDKTTTRKQAWTNPQDCNMQRELTCVSECSNVTPFLITQGKIKTVSNETRSRHLGTCTDVDEVDGERRPKSLPFRYDVNRRRHSVRRPTLEDTRIVNTGALRRFRCVAICIQTLIRWLKVIVDISKNKSTRTATEEQWYTLYTSKEAQKLAFNKSLFVTKGEAFARVPFWAREILNAEPETRSEIDCRKIHALLRGLKSFDKFTEKIQLSMCRAFRYICVESGRIILRKGHVGFNFYFIYSGSVFVNITDRNVEGREFETTVTVLSRGDAFGELALLQDIRRTASITCRETCEMLVVDKETFAHICPKIFEQELEEKEQFLSKLPYFKNTLWTKENIKQICADAQIQEYKTNKVICTDDENDEWMYICMEGKCHIIRQIKLDHNLKKKRMEEKRASTPILSDEILDILGKIKSVQEPTGDDRGDDSSDDNEAAREGMLDSMSLEYRKDGRRRRLLRSEEQEEPVVEDKIVVKGSLTLTALMSKYKKSVDGKDHAYIHIAMLNKEQIFDIFCCMHPHKRPINSTLILVSTGAKILRMKRKNFLSTGTPEALAHVKLLAKRERYPTEESLYKAYRQRANWDCYKNSVVQQIVTPHIKEHGRFSKITKAQILLKREVERRNVALLSTLERCSTLAKAQSKRQRAEGLHEDDDESSDEDERVKDYSSRSLYVLAQQTLQQPFKPIQKDFAVGRRASLAHDIATLKDPYEIDDCTVGRKLPRRYYSNTNYVKAT